MTDVSELLEELARAPGPPSRLRPRDIYTMGRRRHRRAAAAMLVAASVVVVMLVTGVAFATRDGGADPARPEPPADATATTEQAYSGSVVAAAASDVDHLYAVVLDCTAASTLSPAWSNDCKRDLVRSNDAGRTWQVRSRDIGNFDLIDLTALTADILSVQVEKLISAGTLTESGGYVSIDGGQTWKRVDQQDTPTPSMAADGWLERTHQPGGGFLVGDPRLARSAPLANAPALGFVRWSLRTATGSLWIGGNDPGTDRPAVAISNDAGRSWSTQVFTDVPSLPDSTYSVGIATFDGHTGYAVAVSSRGLDGGGKVWVHRTTDGGQTWQRVDPDGTAPWSYGGGNAFVTPDGAHVIADLGRDGRISFRISRDGGAHYTPVTLTGLPTDRIGNGLPGEPVRPIPGGGYLAYAPADAVYISTDGLQWRRVVPQAP